MVSCRKRSRQSRSSAASEVYKRKAVDINEAGANNAQDPVDRRDLSEASVEDRRSTVTGVDYRVHAKNLSNLSVEELRQRPACSGEHSKTSVLDFGLTVIVEILL